MTLIITFYFLKDWRKLEDFLHTSLKKLVSNSVIEIIGDINNKLAAYIKGQLLICCILSVFYGVSLYFTGIKEYIVCGLFSGCLSCAPFFGPVIGLLVTLAMAIDDYVSVLQYVFTCCLYIVIPLLDSNFLTPRFIGKSTGIHPIWLLFSICVTISVLGTCGILISVPIAVTLSTVCQNAFKKFNNRSSTEVDVLI
jgi:putative permease